MDQIAKIAAYLKMSNLRHAIEYIQVKPRHSHNGKTACSTICIYAAYILYTRQSPTNSQNCINNHRNHNFWNFTWLICYAEMCNVCPCTTDFFGNRSKLADLRLLRCNSRCITLYNLYIRLLRVKPKTSLIIGVYKIARIYMWCALLSFELMARDGGKLGEFDALSL